MNYEISTIKKNESEKLKNRCPIFYPNSDYKTFTTIFSRYLRMIETLSLYNYDVDTLLHRLGMLYLPHYVYYESLMLIKR
ncbi:MAG: hypothetical protein COA66_02875 [Arcobacter sp.]|nr:MAG: hypothetical protein COA66_02875 [Arcobacter sp.]